MGNGEQFIEKITKESLIKISTEAIKAQRHLPNANTERLTNMI